MFVSPALQRWERRPEYSVSPVGAVRKARLPSKKHSCRCPGLSNREYMQPIASGILSNDLGLQAIHVMLI